MCGIVGVRDFRNKIERELIIKMSESLSHRGPDDAGIFIDESAGLGLGHRRLSIIDLSEKGRQPMLNDDKNLVIVFNGEIYNFREIKKDLLAKGYKFSSESDTEVVLKSYQEWGRECVNKFRGMFAFALWDKRRQELILIRDRTGVKPLYYYSNSDLFIFASEIKAILCHPQVKKELDFKALRLFLELGYIPAPFSIFKNIRKLEGGHFLILHQNKKMTKAPYWSVDKFYLKQLDYPSLGKKKISEETTELEEILAQSFKLRLVADVEVGHFLSGGLDSSLVAAILTKKLGFNNLKTFTIGFNDEKLNEAPFAKKIADYLETEHHELYCEEKEAKEILSKLPGIYDEPFGDSSAIPTYLLAKFARQFVKVSLSADGGDEIFCGYDRYWVINKIYKNFQKLPQFLLKSGLTVFNLFPPKILDLILPSSLITKKKIYKFRRKINKLKEIIKKPGDLISFYLLLGFGFWKEPELSKLLLSPAFYEKQPLPGPTDSLQPPLDNLSNLQLFDYKTYLPDDILVKVDRATMANSLEGREPLLDHKIIEYVAQLPIGYKYQPGQSKYILRRILYKYIPQELWERPKQGFSIPLEKWLRGDLKYLLDNYLDKKRLEREGIFNPEIIEEEKEKFLQKNIDYADHLWLILMFEMWREKWLGD